MKKLFNYISPIWSGDDGKPSLRSIASIALIVDFIINVHNSASVLLKVLKLLYREKAIEPALISSMSGNLAQIVMILGIEAGLIAAMLALKTYQNSALSTIFPPSKTKSSSNLKAGVDNPDEQN